MPQKNAWEREYQQQLLVSKDERPQNFLVQFLKYLKKDKKLAMTDLQVLDLGCGTGRNTNYLAERGNNVVGIDIAANALRTGEMRVKKLELESSVNYINQSIGAPLPFADNYFDLILDITSSNSLKESEREIYLKECHRVLKPGGFIILRALCKDGDKNAKKLLELSPGKEYDTYFMKELGLVERVFSEKDLRDLYGRYFNFDKLTKDIGYPKVGGRVYTRRYWLAILTKK
ncbi:MAG: class I SAM-dependent methyltransferase [Candidatus Falkowbacteria bacterium]